MAGRFGCRIMAFGWALFLVCTGAPALDWNGTYTQNDPSTFPGQAFFPKDGQYFLNSNNLVNVVNGPDLNGNVIGGLGLDVDDQSRPVNVTGNKVILNGGVSINAVPHGGSPDPCNTGSVYGGIGLNYASRVSGNTVLLDSGYAGTVAGNVIGGSADAYQVGYFWHDVPIMMSTSDSNGVTVKSGTVGGFVAGGETVNGLAGNNTVTISGGEIKKGVAGGFSAYGGRADNNAVVVTGGKFADYVPTVFAHNLDGSIIYGGSSEAGSASGNTVSLGGSAQVGSYVYGGYVNSKTSAGTVANNAVTVSVNVNKVVVGGQTSGTGAVSGNSVTVLGGDIIGAEKIRYNTVDENNNLQGHLGASVAGGVSAGNGLVSGNRVEISGGGLGHHVYGGIATGGNASGNSVVMTGGTTFVGSANMDGRSNVYGGNSHFGDATDNSVGISGAATVVNGDVFGGEALDAPDGADVKADGNTVTITGADIRGSVHGGRSDGSDMMASRSASYNTVVVNGGKIRDLLIGGFAAVNQGTAVTTHNTVSVSGDVTFGAAAEIWGGNGDSGDITGNILNTSGVGYSVSAIKNFEEYTFALSGDYAGRAVYAITGGADVDLSASMVHTTFTGEGAPLKTGEVFTLFDKAAGQHRDDYTYDGRNGILFNHTLDYENTAGDQLDIVITGTTVADESRIPGQSLQAGLQLANAASDLAHDIHGLFDVAEIRQREGDPCDLPASRMVAFAGMRGGVSKWDTGGGSEITMDSVSAIMGLGRRFDGLLLAGFFEAGMGGYDIELGGRRHTRNEDAKYIGGGALIRVERGGFYAEGTGHAGSGRVKLDALINGKTRVDYKVRSAYFGAGAAVGYKWFWGCSSLDVSARYGWNRFKGDDIRAGGHDMKLHSLDSHRIRAGARWTYGGGVVNPYVGAHFQYEADGKASASAYGYGLHSAKARGASGIGEVGVHIGDTMKRVGFDIGVEGYAGKRKGITGKAMLGISF